MKRAQPIPQKTKREVWERDGGICQRCGTMKCGPLHPHHKKYRSRGGSNSVINLVLLGAGCHRAVHNHAPNTAQFRTPSWAPEGTSEIEAQEKPMEAQRITLDAYFVSEQDGVAEVKLLTGFGDPVERIASEKIFSREPSMPTESLAGSEVVSSDPLTALGQRVLNLKVWIEYFPAVLSGIKPWEVRINDRDYKPGDLLILWEWDRDTKLPTGSRFVAKVGFVLKDFPGVKPGWVVFTLERPSKEELKAVIEHAKEPVL